MRWRIKLFVSFIYLWIVLEDSQHVVTGMMNWRLTGMMNLRGDLLEMYWFMKPHEPPETGNAS